MKAKEGPSAAEEVHVCLILFVPTFEDENERTCFEEWVKTNWDAFLTVAGQQTRLRRVPSDLSGSTDRYESIERHARESATLVDLLEEYRERIRNGACSCAAGGFVEIGVAMVAAGVVAVYSGKEGTTDVEGHRGRLMSYGVDVVISYRLRVVTGDFSDARTVKRAGLSFARQPAGKPPETTSLAHRW